MLEAFAFLSAVVASYSYFRVLHLRREIEKRHPGFDDYVRARRQRFHF